jgi:hypothetical protein
MENTESPTITRTNEVQLFRKEVTTYSENHKKCINSFHGKIQSVSVSKTVVHVVNHCA